MKAVILAGGKGTRLSEETLLKPKPMVEIGEMPILWHVMKYFSHYGVRDFVILCGYKSHIIKNYFADYFLHMSDVTIDVRENKMSVHRRHAEPWRITLLNTGLETMTGGRLKRAREHVAGERFFFTYGDGLSDVDLGALLDYHKRQKRLATVTATQHVSRFGVLSVENEGAVSRFTEKPVQEGCWMNSGYFVLEPGVIDYIEGDDTTFEKEPIQALVSDGELAAFRHNGFFAGMDSLRDKTQLEEMWNAGKAPWKVWKDGVEERAASSIGEMPQLASERAAAANGAVS